MTEPIRVLIVDDEEPIRNLLRKGFQSSRQHKYEVVCAGSPEECNELEPFHKSDFDVCIIDLGFENADAELVGFKMLLVGVISQGLTIVYTGHPAVKNVVRAMQLGADDFVSKSDSSPHMLVEHIEKLLAERQEQDERRRCIDEYVHLKNGALSQEYPGRVLAIVIDETGPQVVAHGNSRLDALLRYAKSRKEHSKWPVDPYLYIVPEPATTHGGGDELYV